MLFRGFSWFLCHLATVNSATENFYCLHFMIDGNSRCFFFCSFIQSDWLWCHDFHPFITAAVYFSNHSHKGMSLFDETVEWRKNKTQKPWLHVPSKINKKRDEKMRSFCRFVCLPFGGFCGFPFHLENILNDTHLLNMLSSPFLQDEKSDERERKTKNEKLLNVHLFE